MGKFVSADFMLWHYSGIVVTKTNKWRIYEMVQQKRFGRSATVRITFKIDFCTENITASRYSENWNQALHRFVLCITTWFYSLNAPP